MLGGVDADAADSEADDAGEGAAFNCCAGGDVSLELFVWCGEGRGGVAYL